MPLLMAHSPRIAILLRPLYYYVRRQGSITSLETNPKSVDVLQAFLIVIARSRALPAFRHELEFQAVRFLTWSAEQWAACDENWSLDCQRRARVLLDAVDRPDSSNPYLGRVRHAPDARKLAGSSWSGFRIDVATPVSGELAGTVGRMPLV